MTQLTRSKWNKLQENLGGQDFLTSKNAVIASLSTGAVSIEQGTETLRQYFYIVVTIVQFLTIAMVRLPGAKVKKELRRNLGEELGSRTNGRPHQEILEALLLSELDISARSPWNEVTKEFITTLLLRFNTYSLHYIAGMIYALEATACPELTVVAEIINLVTKKETVNLASLKGRADISRLKKQGDAATLQDFLALHTLDFELGHESGLRTTLEPFVQTNWQEFENGFHFVLEHMHSWWLGLATP